VFLPSGTMCNQIAFRVHAKPGDEVIMHEESHPAHLEGGAIASLCQLMIYTVKGPRGTYTAEAVAAATRPDDEGVEIPIQKWHVIEDKIAIHK